MNDTIFLERGQIGWDVDKGLSTDCASIPSFAWKFIDPPCTDDFVAPAIIHDRYANNGVRDERIPYRAVHDMFYFALMANGVDKLRARIMWVAVRMFDPRWEPIGEKASWLAKNGRKYLETGGNIFFISKNANTNVDVKL